MSWLTLYFSAFTPVVWWEIREFFYIFAKYNEPRSKDYYALAPQCVNGARYYLSMKKGKILFISQEISPYLPSSPTADLGRLIPQSMHERGYEVRTFMPRYGMVNERRNQLHEVIRLSGMNLVINDGDHPLIIKVASLLPSRMQVYFIDSEDYFHKNSKVKETEAFAEDNDERTIFFTRGVLETVKRLRWEPMLVQCSGWISSLVSLYVRNKMSDDPSFRNVKIIYSLMNDRFEGTFDSQFVDKLLADGFAEELLSSLKGRGVDHHALAKFGMETADAIVVGEPEVSEELVELARNSGKPLLLLPELEDLAEACDAFYSSLLEQ